MNQNQFSHQENKAINQLFYLLLFALAGLVVFFLLGITIVYLKDGRSGVATLSQLISSSSINFKIILVAQQLGLFLTPAILLSWQEKQVIKQFYGLKTPKLSLLFWVALLSMCWLPTLNLINTWNQQLVLPNFLNGIENWMRQMEASAMQTTYMILKMNNINDFMLNIFVIALVPAVCEEFIFRGALLRTIFRIKSNPHVAIWLAAAIFSTIHFQFFGFFPRMLLGAAFGYIYFWTGSIWYAVFAHFLNNAYAVGVAFYLQINHLPYENTDDITLPWYTYASSAVLTVFLFKVIMTKTFLQKK